jgi:tetratricopeptide (TPR) repeat protein
MRRKSREPVGILLCFMVFGAKSATGVPRLQRPNFGVFPGPALGKRLATWATGRAVRGFLTTAACTLAALLTAGTAHAEATARFADLPAPGTAPAGANAPAAAAPAATADAPAFTSAAASSAVGDAPSSALPQVSFTRRLAQSHLERAELLEVRGDIAQALHEYTETIGIDSTLGDAYLRLGALRERMGDAREADLVYSAAVGLSDTRSKALLRRSHLRRAAGLTAQALRDLESAVELDDSRALLEELARDYVELHAWSAALAVFRRIAADAAAAGDAPALETARLEVRALRVLAAETDPSQDPPPKHDWVSRALRSIARR